MNKYLDTVVIAPITSQSKDYPTRVMINHEGNENWVVVDQIRTIDKARLAEKIGMLNQKEIASIKHVIKETYVD
jgi:mRNA interferase MazF